MSEVPLYAFHVFRRIEERHLHILVGRGEASPHRCRANVAHIRDSRPDDGLTFKAKVHNTVQVVLISLGSGMRQ